MRRRYIVTILTALGVVGYLALDDKQTTPENASIDAISQEPDYIIQGVKARHYDKHGVLGRRIEAKSAQHLPITDTTKLIEPSVILRDKQNPTWTVKSQKGQLLGTQTLELDGDVQVLPMKGSQTELSLKTEHISIDLDKQIADTSENVTIESPDTKIRSKGMNMNMITQQVQFTSQVRGQHDPKEK